MKQVTINTSLQFIETHLQFFLLDQYIDRKEKMMSVIFFLTHLKARFHFGKNQLKKKFLVSLHSLH